MVVRTSRRKPPLEGFGEIITHPTNNPEEVRHVTPVKRRILAEHITPSIVRSEPILLTRI